MKKSMIHPSKETIEIWLPDANKTRLCGISLAHSLYAFPVDILLHGPLGAGKTAFIQGLAEGLQIDDILSSPTYALEQRYATTSGIPFIHIDLYRLKPAQAAELIEMTDDHTGIRCIEWADRIHKTDHASITIDLTEKDDGRVVKITFEDIALPSEKHISHWRTEMHLPAHVIKHCEAVGTLSRQFAEHLVKQGIVARPQALDCAGQLHDLMRFIDFKPGAAPADHLPSKDDERIWEELKDNYSGMNHEEAITNFLQVNGYPALASMIELHGLRIPLENRTTIEQKILYYADKRVLVDELVTLNKRFEDFRMRYGQGVLSEDARRWHKEAKIVEDELFPDGPPL